MLYVYDMNANVAALLPRSGNNYVSPSDEIMSPCTAKLNALRNKQVGKYVIFLLFSVPPPPSAVLYQMRSSMSPKIEERPRDG